MAWNRLPNVVVMKILGQLELLDQIRSMLVSKSWKHILSRCIPTNSVPWRLTLELSSFDADSYMTCACFESISAEEKTIYGFELPIFEFINGEVRQGGWFCGASGSWLVIAVGPKRDTTLFLFLWNPLKARVIELPPLSTLSSNILHLLKSGTQGYNISSFIKRVHVFSRESVVAVIFSDPEGDGKQDHLSLCTPKDKKWMVLETDNFYSFSDILFHDEKLHVLANDGDKSSTYTINLSNCQVQVCVMRLNYKVENPRGDAKVLYNKVRNPLFNVKYDDKIYEHLVEVSGELLVMTFVYDLYSYNCDGGGPVKPFQCHQVQRIEIRKVDGLEKVETLGNQHIFLSDTGSLAVPVKQGGNRISFTTGYVRGWVGAEECVLHENGIFNLENGELVSAPEYIKHHPVHYRTAWLTPTLL